MYDANKSYSQNYAEGPFSQFLKNEKFPKIIFKGKPKFDFLGVPLFIPFGVPAGPLLNSKYIKVALEAGFCLPTYKTVRSTAWKSHEWPNILKIDLQSEQQIFSYKNIPKVTAGPLTLKDYKNHLISISNSFGVPSQDPDVWSEDFKQIYQNPLLGQHVVLSFQATAGKNHLLEDVEKISQCVIQTVESAKSCLVEINLSCPNESNEPIYKSLKDSVEVLKIANNQFKYHPQIKLIAKIGAMDFESTYAFLSETSPFIQAISAINTVSANILDKQGKIILGSGSQTGGVCGAAILRQGLLMCEYLAKARERCKLKETHFGLIGVGGVSEVMHFNNYRDAGADVVQAATGIMWNLDLASQIAQALQVSFNIE